MNTAVMGVATIALLGPLAIDGDATALAPRDRVVLSALALHGSEVSSVERLADALWGPEPPVSWPKVVPGCVHRLRRALGANAIETTPYGYRLAVDDDDIDTRRFEHLLRRGRELLALGDADRAAYTLGEAVGLWRGAAYLDLDGWEPGRIEAARLGELRLEAQESRIEAALQAGRHADALAPAHSAVAEAPLRERRWGLLALAQYRCGRQGEALQTLRRARQMLVTELGLDPGPELVTLEAAILRQDPSLTVAPSEPASGDCPYLGLVGYDIADAESFFGREWEIADCVSRLTAAGVLAVVGPSGCGKSSLVRAGVGAALGRSGCRSVVMTPGPHPMAAIADLETVGVALIVDQFEEVFTNCADADERQRFCADIAARGAWCRVIISLRADHIGALAAYPELARMVERGLYLLGPMDADALRSAITGPADRAGLLLEPGLVDLLVREVEGEPGALPLLSHALRQTWERRAGRTLTVAAYQEIGGIRGCVARSAEDLYESLTEPQRDLLRQVMLRLVSTTDDGDPIRARVPQRLLLADPVRERMVDRLVQARLVTTDRDTVQIAHESVARAWPRLISWLDEDVEGQRVLRHLTASADAWEGLGRPDSELYRGIRLERALDWRRRAAPELTPAEQDFLAAGVAGRDAVEWEAGQRARQQARVRRRTRVVVVGVALLLVAVAVAGALAVHQQRQREEADRAALVTQAQRVDDASRASPEVDRALLLALEANRVDNSPQTRAVLAGLLSDHPAMIRSLVLDDTVRTLAASPDGSTLLVGEGDTGTSTLRTDTLARTGRSDVNGWSIYYRADGRQLLLGGKGGGGLGEDASTVSAATSGPDLSGLQNLGATSVGGTWVFAADVAYSADGRRLAVYAEGSDGHTITDTGLLVWDVDALDRPLLDVGAITAFATALSPDGSVSYVLTPEPRLLAIDVASSRVVVSTDLPPGLVPLPPQPTADDFDRDLADTLEVSPDGRAVAVAEGSEVVLFDAAGLTERVHLYGPTDRVRSLRFSHDGRLLAAGSDDHHVVVWDVGTAGVVERLAGHAGAVLAVEFSPDDATLFSGGEDHRVLVWDLAGRRRLITRIANSDPGAGMATVALPSPDGRSVAYAGVSAAGPQVRFLDVATGVSTSATVDRVDTPIVAWPGSDDQVVLVADHRDVRVWDSRSGRATVHVVTDADVTALAVTGDGGFAAVGDALGKIARVEAGSLEPAGPQVPLGHPVVAVAALPDGRAVVFLDDMSYAVVDLGDGAVQWRDQAGFKALAAAVAPDGSRVAVGGRLGAVGVLDLGTRQWIASPRSIDRESVLAVSYASDGATFTTSSSDGTVRLWDGRTGGLIAGMRVGDGVSPAMAIDIAGQPNAVAATRSGTVYRLDTRFSTWAAFACAVAGRNLSAAEWQAVFGDRPHHDTCPVG